MDARRGLEISTLQARVRKCFVPVLVFFIICLGLQAAGFGTLGWMVMKISDFKIEIGLWAIRYCTENECDTKDLGEMNRLTNGAFGMTEFQVETSIALGLLLIAIVILLCCRCMSCQRSSLQGSIYTLVVLSLISGILALVASGKFGDDIRKAHDLLNIFGLSPFKVPYSVILTGLGGLLALIMALVVFIAIKPWRGDNEPPPMYEMPTQPGPQYAVQPGAPYTGHPPAQYQYPSQYSGQPAQPAMYDMSYGRKY